MKLPPNFVFSQPSTRPTPQNGVVLIKPRKYKTSPFRYRVLPISCVVLGLALFATVFRWSRADAARPGEPPEGRAAAVQAASPPPPASVTPRAPAPVASAAPSEAAIALVSNSSESTAQHRERLTQAIAACRDPARACRMDEVVKLGEQLAQLRSVKGRDQIR